MSKTLERVEHGDLPQFTEQSNNNHESLQQKITPGATSRCSLHFVACPYNHKGINKTVFRRIKSISGIFSLNTIQALNAKLQNLSVSFFTKFGD